MTINRYAVTIRMKHMDCTNDLLTKVLILNTMETEESINIQGIVTKIGPSMVFYGQIFRARLYSQYAHVHNICI